MSEVGCIITYGKVAKNVLLNTAEATRRFHDSSEKLTHIIFHPTEH